MNRTLAEVIVKVTSYNSDGWPLHQRMISVLADDVPSIIRGGFEHATRSRPVAFTITCDSPDVRDIVAVRSDLYHKLSVVYQPDATTKIATSVHRNTTPVFAKLDDGGYVVTSSSPTTTDTVTRYKWVTVPNGHAEKALMSVLRDVDRTAL